MFAHRFFASRMFAPRYFPPVTTATPAPAVSTGSHRSAWSRLDARDFPLYREDEEIIVL